MFAGKVLVFDLGRVVFDYDLNKLCESLSKYSVKSGLFNNVDSFIYANKELLFKYEKGQISSVDFYKKIINILSLKNLSFEKFSFIWNDIFSPIKETIELINSLSKNYELAILSNTNQLHFDYLYKKYSDFFMNFKKFHLSYLMNTRKPETEIYKQVIRIHNVDPQNIFFTDDNFENVYSAMLVGIKAFQFKNFSKLQHDLKIFGLE